MTSAGPADDAAGRSDSEVLPDLGTILSVWAHPDDESYSCAGLMAAAVRAGRRVVCVTATRGELGSTDPDRWPPGPSLAAVRSAELAQCLAEIGVTEHIWLDYPDGGCADVDAAEATARIRAIVEDVAPDTVLTFGPDGATYHPDHIAVSGWTTAAVAGSSARLHYATTTYEWNERVSQFIDPALVMMEDREPLLHSSEECSIYVILTGDLLELKWHAMLRQESQVGALIDIAGPDAFRELLATEAFRDAADEA